MELLKGYNLYKNTAAVVRSATNQTKAIQCNDLNYMIYYQGKIQFILGKILIKFFKVRCIHV